MEFKEASHQFDSKKLLSYCAALSNERGGLLILGVTDQQPRSVTGTQAFLNIEATEHKIYESLRIKVIAREILYDKKRVVVFQIPPRPPGVPVVYDGKYLMRAGESLVSMTPDTLRRIFDEPLGHFCCNQPSSIFQPPKSSLTLTSNHSGHSATQTSLQRNPSGSTSFEIII